MNEQEESEGNRMRKMIEFIQWKSDWFKTKATMKYEHDNLYSLSLSILYSLYHHTL